MPTPTKKSPVKIDKKDTKKGPKKSPFLPGGPGFAGNFVSTVLIFLLLISAYSLFTTSTAEKEHISLSRVATDVKAGTVSTIKVEGNNLELSYSDGTTKLAMKDPDASLPATLTDYGTTPEQISAVAITIANESSLKYWFLSLAPILLPIL
ncbi:MAG: ATP-dependent metallopeptidase FtsH/Yme1/Tma family protein, partial [Patescibacteria group bacterium]